MNKLKFSNIQGNKATMLIYKHIGHDANTGYGIDGNSFANEVLCLNEYYANDIKCIDVRINSGGGDVQDGFSIVSAILNSKIPVHTYIDGMAYSMAGVIAMCGAKRYMADYGTFMMHEANGESSKKILSLITNSLATVFEQTMSWDMDKVKAMMSKETWMSADECANEGMFEIVPTGNKRPATSNTATLHTFYNSIINKQIKPNMNKVTNYLKLSNEASEDAILNKVEEIASEKEVAEKAVEEKQKEIDALKLEKEALEANVKAFEDIASEAETASVATEIENAIKANKITAESKETWINSGLKSDALKNLFSSMKATGEAVKIFNASKVTDAGVSADRKDWKYRDWEKKDPKGLLELKNTNEEAFNMLLKTINVK